MGALTFTVVMDDEGAAAHDAEGVCMIKYEKIALARGMGHAYTRQVLVHELIHAMIGDAGNLPPADISGDSEKYEEAVCCILAPRILDLIRRNPTLMEYLTS